MAVLLFVFFAAGWHLGAAQNINGEQVIVGKESITIINFPDKVLNINFSDDAAYDFYIPKRREEKSISLQFNKYQQDAPPNTNLLVNEGGRSHMFRILFDSTYNINDDSRPPLWYEHSDLKALRAFVARQKELMDNPDETQARQQAALQQQEAAERKAAYVAAQEQREAALAAKEKQLEKQRKEEETAQKEQAAAIAKAKRDAEEKDRQLQLAAAKEAREKAAAEEKARKEAAALAKQKAENDRQLQLLEEKAQQDKKAAEALAKAKIDAEKKQRLQEEQLARQQQEAEQKRQLALAALAKKEAEQKAAKERLEQLEAERKEREANKAYSEAGLWQRYGKFGINLYDVPREHMGTVISNFYIAKDTLMHAQVADSLILAGTSNLNIRASAPINKGVDITLQQMFFKDVFTYYRLKIENTTNEDFLMGKTYLYWYDEKQKPIKMIKSSYITNVTRFPLIRPGSSQEVVFVTRSPNIIDGESLVLYIDERRKEKGGTSIVIESSTYINELKKVQHDIKTVKTKTPAAEAPATNNKGRKKKRK